MLFRSFLIVLVFCLAAQFSFAEEKHPNVVIILADDFGVGDIQAHYPDNKIATPYLDKFVKEGMSFTDAHSPSAVCTPTRYGLLTGRYCWRTRLQEWVLAAYEPPLISKERETLPKFLQKQGYQTACIGKWHLGWTWAGDQKNKMEETPNAQKNLKWDFTKPIEDGPITRGFDYYFGVVLPNMPPFTYIENDRVVVQPTAKYKWDPNEGTVMPKSFDGSPMAPDWKFDRILPDITEQAVKYVKEKAKDEKPFFLYFSQTSPHEPVVPSKDFKGKSGISPIADFVMETDWSAGQVIKAIDDAGISENTIVIFTADNGHSHYTGWKTLTDVGHKPSGEFRGHKGDIWEGGHRVPFVVRWPNRIEANSKNDHLLCLTDVYATLAQVMYGSISRTAAEDSFSALDSMMGEAFAPFRNTLVSHSVDGEFAFRDADWKIVFKMKGKNRNKARGTATEVELYDLSKDIGETTNVADKNPARVKIMTDKFKELIKQGASRRGANSKNDGKVVFETMQTERWSPAAE